MMPDLTHEELVDRVVCAMTGGYVFVTWTARNAARKRAKSIIAAIAEATERPTEAMIRAPFPDDYTNSISSADLVHIHQAMHRASPLFMEGR